MALLGACRVLQCRFVTRRAAWDAEWLTQLCSSLVQSSGHEGPLAQASLHNVFTFVAFRFSPTALMLRDPASGALAPPLERLRAEMIAGSFADGGGQAAPAPASAAAAAAAEAAASSAPTPWRYSLLRHAVVGFMSTPGREGAGAGALVSFFLSALDSDNTPLRPFAAIVILSFLCGDGGAAGCSTPEETAASGASRAAAVSALASALASPDFAPRVFQRLAHAHAAGAGGAGGAGVLGDGSWENLTRTLGLLVFTRDWPATKKNIPVLWSGDFSLASARLWAEFFAAAPEAALKAMRAPLTEAVTSAKADRGLRAAAAEARWWPPPPQRTQLLAFLPFFAWVLAPHCLTCPLTVTAISPILLFLAGFCRAPWLWQPRGRLRQQAVRGLGGVGPPHLPQGYLGGPRRVRRDVGCLCPLRPGPGRGCPLPHFPRRARLPRRPPLGAPRATAAGLCRGAAEPPPCDALRRRLPALQPLARALRPRCGGAPGPDGAV